MANWQVLENVSRTLQGLLQRRVDDLGLDVAVRVVTSSSFEQLKLTQTPTISLFLYRIVENAETRNQLVQRRSDGSVRRQPLTLELGFLITAWAARTVDTVDADDTAAGEEHQLLGLVVQTMADHAELSGPELFERDPANPVFGSDDGVQVVLESLPVEDHYRIWDSAELSYRLSLTYRVRVVGVDAAEALGGTRVQVGSFTYGEGD